MNYFYKTEGQSTNLRVHPLLLSLTKVFNASDKTRSTPKISSISEDDERVLSHKYYAKPGNFPPLDMHFSGGGMGAYPLSDANI
jgi:hypothetical protein